MSIFVFFQRTCQCGFVSCCAGASVWTLTLCGMTCTLLLQQEWSVFSWVFCVCPFDCERQLTFVCTLNCCDNHFSKSYSHTPHTHTRMDVYTGTCMHKHTDYTKLNLYPNHKQTVFMIINTVLYSFTLVFSTQSPGYNCPR